MNNLGRSSNNFEEVDGAFRFGGVLASSVFKNDLQNPTSELYVRSISSLKSDLLETLQSQGIEWYFTFSGRQYVGRIHLIDDGNKPNKNSSACSLEIERLAVGRVEYVFLAIISIDLLRQNFEDAKFLLFQGNNQNGSIIPVVRLLRQEHYRITDLEKEEEWRFNVHRFTREKVTNAFRADCLAAGNLPDYSANTLRYPDDGAVDYTACLNQIENCGIRTSHDTFFSLLSAIVDQAQTIFEEIDEEVLENKEKSILQYGTEIDEHRYLKSAKLNKNKDGSTPIPGAQGQTENKLETTPNIKPEFGEKLEREFFAKLMQEIVDQPGLSNRKAASIAGTSEFEIRRIKSGKATIDKSKEVLEKFGYKFGVHAMRDNELE